MYGSQKLCDSRRRCDNRKRWPGVPSCRSTSSPRLFLTISAFNCFSRETVTGLYLHVVLYGSFFYYFCDHGYMGTRYIVHGDMGTRST